MNFGTLHEDFAVYQVGQILCFFTFSTLFLLHPTWVSGGGVGAMWLAGYVHGAFVVSSITALLCFLVFLAPLHTCVHDRQGGDDAAEDVFLATERTHGIFLMRARLVLI